MFRNFLLDAGKNYPIPDLVIHDFNRLVARTYWLGLMLREYSGASQEQLLKKFDPIQDLLNDLLKRLQEIVL